METQITNEEMKGMAEAVAIMNKVANEILGNVKYKGTSTYYAAGQIKNKKFCYTKHKTGYKNRWGFWSWIETKYTTKKVTKRTKFALSRTAKKAEARAHKLYDKEMEKSKC